MPPLRRKHVVQSAVLVAVGFGCFALGRWAAPDRVVEDVKEKTATVDRSTEKASTASSKQVDSLSRLVVEKTKLTSPDGTVLEKEVTRTEAATSTKEAEVKVVEKVVEKIVHVERVVHREVTRDRPDWRLGVLATARPLQPWAPEFGVLVERRILGPISLGAVLIAPPSDMRRFSAGLALVVEF